MPTVGETAPDFTANTHSGGKLTLSSLKGAPLVLYFYPEADTSGCTLESKGFRDIYSALRAQRVEVVGVSVDGVEKQCAFADKYSLPFPLVADEPKEVTRKYGVLGPNGKARRVSFFIGPDQKITDVVEGQAAVHVERARAKFLS